MGDWINVNDHLPRRGQEVIAWAADGKDQTKNLMQQATFLGGDFYYGYHSSRMRGVTHWCPLPEPPEATND